MRFSPGALMTALLALGLVLAGSALGDGSLDRVQEAGVLVVGTEGEYPPFNYFENGELVGFDIDIANEIAGRLGVDIEFVPTAWDGIVIGLLNERYDTIIASLGITPERAERVAFTQPYYRSGAQIVTPEGSDITAPDDVVGKRVGAAVGTTYADRVEDIGAELVLYDDDLQSIPDVTAGRLDAAVTDRLVVLLAIQERGYNLQLVDELLFTEEMGIAVRLEEQDLLEAIDSALTEMYEDGTYTEISERWFGEDIR